MDLLEEGIDLHLFVNGGIEFKGQGGEVAHDDFLRGVDADKAGC